VSAGLPLPKKDRPIIGRGGRWVMRAAGAAIIQAIRHPSPGGVEGNVLSSIWGYATTTASSILVIFILISYQPGILQPYSMILHVQLESGDAVCLFRLA
jgi:hypothetical protein